MTHPLVTQLRFARSEFQRGLVGLSDEETRRRFLPMNCISWNIGHLAWQEQRYWLERLQDKVLLPELNEMFCFGCPAATPPLAEMREAWEIVTNAADPLLDTLTTEDLVLARPFTNPAYHFTAGSLMLRTIYHYWYHNGENQAIRQMLGHTNLPPFVGNIDEEAPYQPH